MLATFDAYFYLYDCTFRVPHSQIYDCSNKFGEHCIEGTSL